MKLHTTAFAAAICAAIHAFAVADVAAKPEQGEYQRLVGARVGGFWGEQYKRIVTKWIPHCVREMEAGGEGEEMLNLVAAGDVLAGREPRVKFKGCPWSDAYPYNTVEAASLALELDPGGDAELAAAQDFLRAKIEEWIPVFLAAQEKSGYIHSFHALNGNQHFSRYTDHEFYVMGYFIEMGIAHRAATGDRRLFDAAVRCADHLDSVFGPPPKRTWMNGHPGLEYALCRLSDATGDKKYARLAQFFIRHQHTQKGISDPYNQSERPAVEMKDASGHAVRAAYFYAGMAGVANRLGDEELGKAAERLFGSILDRKYYLTGGIGSQYGGEAFGADYELPQNAYAESCAGCGLEFLAREMRRVCADTAEAVRERVLYNNILGAISQDGESFYYQNPLSAVWRRTSWHSCPCCVGNIPRTLLALKDTVFSVSGDTLFVNQYVDVSNAKIRVGGREYAASLHTGYPRTGGVRLETDAPVKVFARFPNRAESALYLVEPETPHGYREVGREWTLPLPEQTVHAVDAVASCRGRVAHQRGPIVYSVEDGKRLPNYARLNGDANASVVWEVEDAEKAGLHKGSTAKASVSFARGGMGLVAVNDGERSEGNFDFWPHKGTEEWIRYDFDKEEEISHCVVVWFDDTGSGECRLPASWTLQVLSADGEWKDVPGLAKRPASKDGTDDVTFAPVRTKALRLLVELPKGWSSGVREWAVDAPAEILVGVTGYGESPEFAEVVTNGECNLFVQWSRSGNLIPEGSKLMTPELFEQAKRNRVRVMTIYGDQNGAKTKALREAWGDLYLGNNIGEYAGFLYQDEKSYSKNWPQCRDLKEAHDWLVGSMLAAPKKAQLARPEGEREPCVLSTSGSPLACYELEGGIDAICNEMYAVGCGNLAYATSEARGAARRHGRASWSAWLAHEWQTCWPRLPYGVAQKQDSLEVGLKELWLMGTSMMVLESGSQTTQAQDYTPPDGTMAEFKSPKQGYDGDVPKAYRGTMREFYRWTRDNPRPAGSPLVNAALLIGNLDGYVGMAHDIFAVFGQHHIAATNSNWKCGAPEFTWEAVMEEFFPRPADALRPFANGWIGGTPHGQVDVVNVDDNLKASDLARYRAVAFGGWNTMTPKIAEVLREYVAKGGQVALCVPQMSSRVDREFTNYSAEDLVQAVPGVTVKGPQIVEDILMVGGSAPDFLRRAYPAHLSVKLRVADAELGANAAAVATMGKKPYLVRAAHGRGAFWLCLAWDYPAARREGEEFPSFRASFRLDFWKTLLAGMADSVAPGLAVSGPDAAYVNWAVYPDGTMYMLNTDCVGPRQAFVDGETQEIRLGPKELRRIERK